MIWGILGDIPKSLISTSYSFNQEPAFLLKKTGTTVVPQNGSWLFVAGDLSILLALVGGLGKNFCKFAQLVVYLFKSLHSYIRKCSFVRRSA